MGEAVNIESIETHGGFYCVNFKFIDTGKEYESMIKKEALFALLCVAEKNQTELEKTWVNG